MVSEGRWSRGVSVTPGDIYCPLHPNFQAFLREKSRSTLIVLKKGKKDDKDRVMAAGRCSAGFVFSAILARLKCMKLRLSMIL